MSLFNDIINGKGNASFRWSVTTFKGDEDFEYHNYSKTYEESLAFRIDLIVEDEESGLCELWYRPEDGPEDWVGDESDWNLLQENLKKIEKDLENISILLIFVV